jgi:hypothetical protein
MKIDKDSWHCKLYCWWYTHRYPQKLIDHEHIWNNTTQDYDIITTQISMQQYSNLCPYMRAVMFWAPMRAVTWNWIKIGKVPLNAITIPAAVLAFPFLLKYPYSHRVWLIYLVVLITATGAVLILSGIYFVSKRVPWIKKKFLPVVVQYGPPVASFGKLLHEYLRSFHDRICPEVEWKD